VKYAAVHGASFCCLRFSISSKLSKGWRKNIVFTPKWLYFQSRLLSFKDIEHWKQPKDAPCKAAYFTYHALNVPINIGGLNGWNHLAKTGTEPAGSGLYWNRNWWSGPKIEPLPKLVFAHKGALRCLDYYLCRSIYLYHHLCGSQYCWADGGWKPYWASLIALAWRWCINTFDS